jgi:RsiW-degrading membrane proteinase PrsW (M82 family)
MTLPLLAASLAPSVLLLWYFYRRDANPEPHGALARTFAWGVAITVPAVVLELAQGALVAPLELSTVAAAVNDALLCAALVEEALKFAILYLYVQRLPAFDEPMDGIIYGVTASLGFATLENVLYVSDHGVGVAVARALTAVPGHAAWGAIMGYYIAQAKFGAAELRGRRLWLALLVPLALHGLYDFPLMWLQRDSQASGLLWLPVAVVVGCWRWVSARTRHLQGQQHPQTPVPEALPAAVVVSVPSQPSRFWAMTRAVIGGLMVSWGALCGLVVLAGVRTEPSDPQAQNLLLGGLVVGALPLGLGLWLCVNAVRTLTCAPPETRLAAS